MYNLKDHCEEINKETFLICPHIKLPSVNRLAKDESLCGGGLFGILVYFLEITVKYDEI